MPRFFGLKGAYHAFGRLAQRELGSFGISRTLCMLYDVSMVVPG